MSRRVLHKQLRHQRSVSFGGIVGEMGIVEQGARRSAAVIAGTRAELEKFDTRKFLALVANKPGFALEVMQVMARRLRVMNRRYRHDQWAALKHSALGGNRNSGCCRSTTTATLSVLALEFDGDSEVLTLLPFYDSSSTSRLQAQRPVVDEVKKTMSTLDDIAVERQRLVERLARVDAERTKLTEQLAELEAAERVLSRFTPTKAATPRRGRRARTAKATEAVSPPARGQRAGRGGRKAGAKQALPLGDATLRAVGALGNDASAEQIRVYLGKEFGMQVRPNHLGMALQRHRRGGRLSERDARWSMAPALGEAPAS
jgi:CRP-like cAMP-binding protein